jgi:hypothetical protein
VSEGTGKICANKPVSLLILEGDTEEVFYSIIRDQFLKSIKIELRNIKGQGNINKDILASILKYTYNNPSDFVRAYCCIDSEGQKITATPLDLNFVRQQICQREEMNLILSVDAILADPDIESWFFYDIERVYAFLKAPHSERNLGKYKQAKNFSKKDLEELFYRFGKAYISGKRTENFINHLDIGKIVSKCKELADGIALVKSQSCDLTNHIFKQ